MKKIVVDKETIDLTVFDREKVWWELSEYFA